MNAEDKRHMPPSQQTGLDRVKGWSEVLQNVVQICAILVAGWWTYHKFIQIDVSSFETRHHIASELSWHPSPNKNYCNAEFKVQVENEGKSPFDVLSVHIQAWKFNAPSNEDPVATFQDPDEIKKGATFLDKEFTSSKLVGPYAPGVKADYSFDWAVQQSPNSMALFSADLEIKGQDEKGRKTNIGWTTENSEEICGPLTQRPGAESVKRGDTRKMR
jgi:hypothetical protein